MRKQIVIIKSVISGKPSIHFCGEPVLSGEDSNRWYELDGDFFETVEKLMVESGIAVNVVRIEMTKNGASYSDHLVTYNATV